MLSKALTALERIGDSPDLEQWTCSLAGYPDPIVYKDLLLQLGDQLLQRSSRSFFFLHLVRSYGRTAPPAQLARWLDASLTVVDEAFKEHIAPIPADTFPLWIAITLNGPGVAPLNRDVTWATVLASSLIPLWPVQEAPQLALLLRRVIQDFKNSQAEDPNLTLASDPNDLLFDLQKDQELRKYLPIHAIPAPVAIQVASELTAAILEIPSLDLRAESLGALSALVSSAGITTPAEQLFELAHSCKAGYAALQALAASQAWTYPPVPGYLFDSLDQDPSIARFVLPHFRPNLPLHIWERAQTLARQSGDSELLIHIASIAPTPVFARQAWIEALTNACADSYPSVRKIISQAPQYLQDFVPIIAANPPDQQTLDHLARAAGDRWPEYSSQFPITPGLPGPLTRYNSNGKPTLSLAGIRQISGPWRLADELESWARGPWFTPNDISAAMNLIQAFEDPMNRAKVIDSWLDDSSYNSRVQTGGGAEQDAIALAYSPDLLPEVALVLLGHALLAPNIPYQPYLKLTQDLWAKWKSSNHPPTADEFDRNLSNSYPPFFDLYVDYWLRNPFRRTRAEILQDLVKLSSSFSRSLAPQRYADITQALDRVTTWWP